MFKITQDLCFALYVGDDGALCVEAPHCGRQPAKIGIPSWKQARNHQVLVESCVGNLVLSKQEGRRLHHAFGIINSFNKGPRRFFAASPYGAALIEEVIEGVTTSTQAIDEIKRMLSERGIT